MKKAGLLLIFTGALLVVFTGVRLLKIEEVLNVGNSGITSTRSDAFLWSPMFGVYIILFGIGFCLVSRVKGPYTN